MSEAVTTEAPVTEAAPAPTTTPAPEPAPQPTAEAAPAAPAFDYGAWADGLSDAAKKDYAKRFKSVDDVLDGALNLRKDIATRVKVPGKDAKPEDVAAFRKAIGAHEKAEEYKAAVPEGYEIAEPQKAMLGLMQQAAAESGVPGSAFSEFTKTYFEAEAAIMEKIEGEYKQYQADTEKRLRKEHGKDYDRRLTAGNALIDKIDKTGETRAFLDKTIVVDGVAMKAGDHPGILNVMAELGLRMGEDGVVGGVTPDERSSIQEQIRKVRSENPVPYSQAVNQQLQQLYAKLG